MESPIITRNNTMIIPKVYPEILEHSDTLTIENYACSLCEKMFNPKETLPSCESCVVIDCDVTNGNQVECTRDRDVENNLRHLVEMYSDVEI